MRTKPRQHYRTKTINMNEMMHIILSLQIMFGSRRAMGAVIVILVLCGGGYLAFTMMSNPARALERADRQWDRDQNVEAIREYKSLLRKRDPLEPQYALLQREDRPRLYRRIISHETRYGNRAEARDWVTMAYSEGLNFERADFEHAEVFELWSEVVSSLGDGGGGQERKLLDEFLKN